MKTLQERLRETQHQIYDRVQRGDQSYQDSFAVTKQELERLVSLHRQGGNLQHLRLIRDSMDHWIRRYHGYTIAGSIGAHYTANGVTDDNCIFEHVIPAKHLRDLLLSGSLTITEALNAPTCYVTREQDATLRQHGLVSATPDLWYFFRRYNVLQTGFSTHNGQRITDLANYTLAQHYQRFVPGYL